MKLLSLICESLNRYDIAGNIPAGFTQYDMDMRPCVYSADALYQMQTEIPIEQADKGAIFSTPGRFLANHVKTRLISNFWPAQHDPIYLDPLASRKVHEDDECKRMEPDCHHFGLLMDFLWEDFYDSEYQHLIYWPYTGHAGLNLRVDEENHGAPKNCSKTWAHWVGVLESHVFPLIRWDETVVLMHPDHGTLRDGMEYDNAMWDGFLMVRAPMNLCVSGGGLNWPNLRQTEQYAIGINFFKEGRECVFY